jgi:hypothetical protein
LVFDGSGTEQLTLAGTDKGASAAGYDDNFSWGTVELNSGVALAIGSDAGRALYAGLFILDGGLTQLANISSAANIYYDPGLAGNAYLHGETYAFGSGGGQLLAAVPEPATSMMWLAGLGAFAFIARRRTATRVTLCRPTFGESLRRFATAP